MDQALFGSDLWKPALDKYAEATGLSVELFGLDGGVVLNSMYSTPLVALFREYRYDPGLFAECARRCLKQTFSRPAVVVDESHGLTVVGTSLVLEGAIVGAAVAGYGLSGFPNVTAVRRLADSVRIPFERLWNIARRQPPVPERRLLLHGELLQVLGDALLRENFRTRQFEDAAAKLEAASAAKDEFLAVVSHELRTPLAPIAGWASVMKNASDLEQVRRAAEIIERHAFLQSRMVDDLLDVSRMRHGLVTLDLEILELPAAVRAAADASAQEAERKAVRLEFAEAGETLCVEGDSTRLQQIFRNILSNAVKFTPEGGSIRVAFGREGSDALVRVADTGKGIAPAFLPFVFDIFRQQEQGTRRSQEGLGIGLALVKRLVELHNGQVSIASAGVGRGTEVTVRLPRAAETPALDVTAPVGTDVRESSLAGLSILVVEDSRDMREALQILLGDLGTEVAAVGDGHEALALMRKGLMPDLILCDLLMPRMDGFEFLRELQRGFAPRRPPVIAVSGVATQASRRRAQQVGFDAHLTKPFNRATLLAALGAALAGRKEPHAAAP